MTQIVIESKFNEHKVFGPYHTYRLMIDGREVATMNQFGEGEVDVTDPVDFSNYLLSYFKIDGKVVAVGEGDVL